MASLLAASIKPQVLTMARSAPSGSGTRRVAGLVQQIEHLLAVDQILGAAKRNQGKGFFHSSFLIFFGSSASAGAARISSQP